MSSSMIVPVIDVQGNNFTELWAAMVLAIKTSSFIAIDLELSGLGSRKALLAECIEERYKAICHAARTRSILSLGFACYKELDTKADSTYLVQIYNLTLLCSEDYIIEPQSVKFLVQHGFDFNKQYAEGISYYKGNDKGGDIHGINMRTLFIELLRTNKPLVVHNGLIDMVFLYQCFYAHLPDRLGTFTADLSQMFPAGIYDTKYATEYELRFTASYLEYAYKKCKLQNSRDIEGGGNGSRVFLEFCKYTGNMESYVDYRPCLDNQNQDDALNICVQFSAYGWCPNGSQCTMSHDTDLIIQHDEKIKEDKRKKRKRKNKKKDSKGASESCSSPQGKRSHFEEAELDQAVPMSEHQEKTARDEPTDATHAFEPGETASKNGNEESQPEAPVEAPDRPKEKKVEGGTHRAGFDAFMTGYIFAYARSLTKNTQESSAAPLVPTCLNKLFLSGKSVPLHIAKSTFSKSSKAHVHKMDYVWGEKHCCKS
ncbi:target of EGR1 protein 1 [Pimephales promelas]|uniref:target of EGR1 protein 1 n=1 Tax=Pimephales promelas TaxID=90988 RepID=UPI001955B908|nr:target of EGR1 protein 1 [Pimephales promelas]KAG1969924.1 target of EGR1 protein [Pimephales promelas]KAG1969925.1 target of EGR1 protein [Pimephales promelas]